MAAAPRPIVALAACALGLAGCSDAAAPTRKPGPAPAVAASPRVTLSLLGGAPGPRLTACGLSARYRTYRFGGFVRYSGRVTPTPAAGWTVKVKLKRCIPHGYSETFFEIVRGRPDGSFGGLVPKLNPNTFYVRADFMHPRGTSRSPLAFFRTVGHG
jgi:hypothetical protein